MSFFHETLIRGLDLGDPTVVTVVVAAVIVIGLVLDAPAFVSAYRLLRLEVRRSRRPKVPLKPV